MQGRVGAKRTRRSAKKTPSASTKFEIEIRADKKLNVTTRLLFWLYANSHFRGYTWATEAEMAKQLGTSIRQVQMSLRVIEEADYFRRVRPPGIHRPRQWHRVYQNAEEKPDEFRRRIQCDDRFDICVLLHWLACDETAKTGTAQFATPREWEVSRTALKKVRHKMQELGHFMVDSDPSSGRPATYRRKTTIVAADAPIRRPGYNPALDEWRRQRRLARELAETRAPTDEFDDPDDA